MSPMHTALKNHMKKIKMDAHPASPMSKTKEDEELGDKAPESSPKMSDVELGPEHSDLLEKLLAGMGQSNRPAMTLDEKANDTMKEKMASIMKHKKHG